MVKSRYKLSRLIFCLLILGSYGNSAHALEQVFYLLSLKTGIQNTGQPMPLASKEDQYLQEIESDHGTRNEDRLTSPLAVNFDFYQVDGSLATGFGIEINRYSKNYSFRDNSKVQLNIQAVLFALSTYYRGDAWFPYFSLGTGSYDVKIREKLRSTSADEEHRKTSYIDSVSSVFYYELGSRFPFGEWGMLVSWRATSAQLKVRTIGKRLELGGQTTFLGVYYTY